MTSIEANELRLKIVEFVGRRCQEIYPDLYDKCRKREATKIVKEQTSEKLREIQSKLQDYEQICDDWANDINRYTFYIFNYEL